MNSFEWEVFKRTGKIEHYLLVKEAEIKKVYSSVEFGEEFFN